MKPFRIGGTETFARELSQQLHERGWNSVLCFQAQPTDEVRRFLDLPNVSIETLENSTDLNLGAAKRLAGIIRKHKAEILHLHFTGFLGVYPWLARLLSVKKIFFTDHSSRPAGYLPQRAPFWKRVAARVINFPITKVVCVSKYGRDCLTTLDLLPRERFELVYNAVDLSRVVDKPNAGAEFKQRYQIPEDRVLIVQVSWMIPEKGIPELLKTAHLLIGINPKVHLVLVGEGKYREQFTKNAEAMGIASHITWTGLVKDPFGEGVFAAADIVCQLSDWEELFGWMIAEAMAFGKPIVATKVGGIPELVDDNISGFLVARGDSATAASQLDRLARDRELRGRLGQAGRELVSQQFDLKRNVCQLIKLYEL
ncbi:MAG TPA: glycosyltransferase family 4 protein [Pyrinomonadaceae bacterium]|nr:glycosyltransferase family 4 protein [Pyrinomonadaceae bacterium]